MTYRSWWGSWAGNPGCVAFCGPEPGSWATEILGAPVCGHPLGCLVLTISYKRGNRGVVTQQVGAKLGFAVSCLSSPSPRILNPRRGPR